MLKVHPPQNTPNSVVRSPLRTASAESTEASEFQWQQRYNQTNTELEQLRSFTKARFEDADRRLEELRKQQIAFLEFMREYPNLEALKQKEIDAKLEPLEQYQLDSAQRLSSLAERLQTIMQLVGAQERHLESGTSTRRDLVNDAEIRERSLQSAGASLREETMQAESQMDAQSKIDRLEQQQLDCACLLGSLAEQVQKISLCPQLQAIEADAKMERLGAVAEQVQKITIFPQAQAACEEMGPLIQTEFQLDTVKRLDSLTEAMNKLMQVNGTNGLKAQKEAEERLDRIDEKLKELPAAITASRQRVEMDLSAINEQIKTTARCLCDEYFQELEKQNHRSTLEELQSSLDSFKKTIERTSGEVESLVIQHERNAEALDSIKDLSSKVDKLNEMGQWGNDALVATQRLEADAQKHSHAFEKRLAALEASQSRTLQDSSFVKANCASIEAIVQAFEKRLVPLESLEKRIADDAGSMQDKRVLASLQAFEKRLAPLDSLEKKMNGITDDTISSKDQSPGTLQAKVASLEASMQQHMSDANEKQRILQSLCKQVEDLGQVGQYASEAMKLAQEMQAVVSRRASCPEELRPSIASLGSQVSFGQRPNDESFIIGRLSKDIEVQRANMSRFEERLTSLEQHLAKIGDSYATESGRRELAMVQIEAACQDASKKIADAFVERSSEAEASTIVKQFQAMLSEVRASVNYAEASRREDVEHTLSSLRGELSGFQENQPQIEDASHLRVDMNSPSRLLTSSIPSTISAASGRLSPPRGVVRLSSAPVRERPATFAPSRSQKASVQSPLEPHWTAVSSQPQIAGTPGPSRSSRQSSPLGMRTTTTLSSRPRSLSPSRVSSSTVATSPLASTPSRADPRAVAPLSSRSNFSVNPVVPPIVNSALRISTIMCQRCGNMCMDEAELCRRCTLNQKNGIIARNPSNDYLMVAPSPQAALPYGSPAVEPVNRVLDVPQSSFGSYVVRNTTTSTYAQLVPPSRAGLVAKENLSSQGLDGDTEEIFASERTASERSYPSC